MNSAIVLLIWWHGSIPIPSTTKQKQEKKKKPRLCRKLCQANTFRVVSCRTCPSVTSGCWFHYTSGMLLLNQIFPPHQNCYSSVSNAWGYWQPENHPEPHTAAWCSLGSCDAAARNRAESPTEGSDCLARSLPAPEQPWNPWVLLEKFPRNKQQQQQQQKKKPAIPAHFP